jgi:precorrin-4 methylase
MKVALQVNAFVGVVSAVAATAMMSLVLTRPAEVASAIAQREYGAIAVAMARELAGWLHALLRLL